MYVVVLLQTWRKEVSRDDFTLGLALVLNDAARKAVLQLSLSSEERGSWTTCRNTWSDWTNSSPG